MRRWRRHVRRALSGSTLRFHLAIAKYGPDEFIVEELFCYSTRDAAVAAEIDLIGWLELQGPAGYNASPGGDLNPMLSPGAQAKQAAAIRGRPLSSEHRAKIGDGLRGSKRTPEQCARLSAALTGRKRAPFSAEWCARLSESKRGKVRTDEAKAKTAAKHRGMKRSPEACARISAAKKTAFARRRMELEIASACVES